VHKTKDQRRADKEKKSKEKNYKEEEDTQNNKADLTALLFRR
jgi:hypothetical protein